MRLPSLRRRRAAGTDADAARIPRKDRRGASPALVGLVVVALLVVGTYFSFAKALPWSDGYKISAVFESASSLRANAPVRIAGVNVGKVTGITQYEDTEMSLVEMEIDESGLPVHKDAALKIRPRIFLEGNFFVDLQPGSPGAPSLEDGDTIRVTQTATPVQLDEVLSALQSDTREDLKDVLAEFGRALDGPPGESDAGQDPSVRGETAGESLNDTYRDAGPALRGASIVQESLLGEEQDDLSAAIRGLQRTTGALGRNEESLQDLVVNFNRTLAVFADEQDSVSATIRELGPTLPQADRAFAALNSAFPSTRAFAREILPGVRESAETIEASFPFIEQTRRLVGPDELQGLVRDLQPASRDLAAATNGAIDLFPQQDLFSRCVDRVLLPAGDLVVREPEGRKQFESGVENYKELFSGLVGLAGEGQNFDGNGQYVRFQVGGGSQTQSTGPSNLGSQGFFRLASPSLGTRPRFPGRRPPYRPDQPCHRQPLPDVNGAAVGPPDGSQGTGAPVAAGAAPAAPAAPTATAARAARASRTERAERPSVAGELLQRLNPFPAGAGAEAGR